MGGMSKLLHKPLKLFVAYAFVVLLLSIPAYFAVVDYIWQDELDENNQVVRQRIEHGLQHTVLSDSSLANLLTGSGSFWTLTATRHGRTSSSSTRSASQGTCAGRRTARTSASIWS